MSLVTPANENIADSLATALGLAIETQQKFERQQLHYTSDSAMLATWKQMRHEIKKEWQL